jgi:hypothetical protein
MGKKRKNNESSKHSRKQKQNDTDDGPTSSSSSSPDNHQTNQNSQDISFFAWAFGNPHWILLCLILGVLVGTFLGTVVFIQDESQLHAILGYYNGNPSSYYTDHFLPRQLDTLEAFLHSIGLGGGLFSRLRSKSVDEHDINAPYKYTKVNGRTVRDEPSHPLTFAILRESVIREKGGYVHPDLGLLIPAPSGAGRGLGMVRDTYNNCQVRCMPGTIAEKVHVHRNGPKAEFPPHWREPISNLNTGEKLKRVLDAQEQSDEKYRQQEVLLKIPLSIQMTRKLALQTLIPLVPNEVLARLPLHELDDAALLVLLLAHERGEGIESIFHPYIASLPLNPSCGFSPLLRKEALDTIAFMGIQMGMDVNGWPGELSKASDRAAMIAEGLSRDYGAYINTPKGASPFATIQWALCTVASRATAASEKHGALRLIPILDMINHDVNAGGFEELSGKEKLENGNFVDAEEDDSGTFFVRSILHGRRKPLRKGQELLVNYNVPNYSPLDWFVSLGFVPPERSGQWVKVENVLPKTRTYGN